MAENVNIGIAAIALGAIAPDGGMGQTLKSLGLTEEGSCKLTFEEAEKTEFFVEEFDTAFHTEYKQGGIRITYTIINPSVDTMVEVLGGTKTGSGVNAVYNAPDKAVQNEKSMKITPRVGLGFEFPRVAVTGKMSSDMGRKSLLKLEVTCDVLQPTKEGLGRFKSFIKS